MKWHLGGVFQYLSSEQNVKSSAAVVMALRCKKWQQSFFFDPNRSYNSVEY